eukprot:332384-Chlamydomonas_euryale.AAC.2
MQQPQCAAVIMVSGGMCGAGVDASVRTCPRRPCAKEPTNEGRLHLLLGTSGRRAVPLSGPAEEQCRLEDKQRSFAAQKTSEAAVTFQGVAGGHCRSKDSLTGFATEG